ncbi:conserved domain protein [Actinomyces sp. oral taxon 170 str. F0386]|nr:conserved domain protein [Actinomyces sp. oral taxon 170 str. F0386]
MQIAVKEERRDKVIEYLGSAHTLPLDLTPIPTVPRDPRQFQPPRSGSARCWSPSARVCCGTSCTGSNTRRGAG